LPFWRRFVLCDYGLEELVQVVDESGFEKLGGELRNVRVRGAEIRARDSQYLQHNLP
jgi:hypothetical protein